MVNGGEQFFFYHRYTHKLAPNIYIKKNIKKKTLNIHKARLTHHQHSTCHHTRQNGKKW